MLKGIPSLLSPELLKILAEMGHGDEITIGDGNFPGQSLCKRVIRLDGCGVPEILQAILTLFPLDEYVEHPLTLMQVVPGDPTQTPIWDTYREIAAKFDARGADLFENIERMAFYERVKEKSYAVIMSGEKATYANLILKKGVVKSEDA